MALHPHARLLWHRVGWGASLALCAAVLAHGAAGCGARSTDDGRSAAPGAVEPGADSAEDPDNPATDRVDASPACSAGHYVETVSGVVLDASASAVPDAKAQLCIRRASSGQLLCLQPATARPDGAFTMTVPERARCVWAAAMRVTVPFADLTVSYCQLDLSSFTTGGRVHLREPVILHPTQRATVLPLEGDASTERPVRFDDGLTVHVVPERYRGLGDGYPALGATRLVVGGPHAGAGGSFGDVVPVAPCFVDASRRPEVLYGWSPEGDVAGEGFALEIPNVTGLSPGTEVSLWVLGGLSCRLDDGTAVPEGEWRTYGTAQVGPEGRVITGGRLPCFTWLGYGLRTD